MAACFEVVWTGAAVLAVALGGAWLLGRLLRPMPAPGAFVVIPARGEGQTVEGSVRAFHMMRSAGCLDCPVVVADMGLTRVGREVALRVCRRWPEVRLVEAEELPQLLPRKEHT